MSKKTKPKHQNKLSVVLLKHAKLLLLFNFLIILSLMLYVLLLQSALTSRNEDGQKTKRLINAGSELDNFQQTLKDAGITSSIERKQFCWLSGEKFEDESQTYCDQRIILRDRLDNEGDIAKLINNFNRAWRTEYPEQSYYSSEAISATKGDSSPRRASLKVGDIHCFLRYSIKRHDFWQERDRGSVVIRLACSEEMNDAIYPIRENTDY